MNFDQEWVLNIIPFSADSSMQIKHAFFQNVDSSSMG